MIYKKQIHKEMKKMKNINIKYMNMKKLLQFLCKQEHYLQKDYNHMMQNYYKNIFQHQSKNLLNLHIEIHGVKCLKHQQQ